MGRRGPQRAGREHGQRSPNKIFGGLHAAAIGQGRTAHSVGGDRRDTLHRPHGEPVSAKNKKESSIICYFLLTY
jgi:hypothetical protein